MESTLYHTVTHYNYHEWFLFLAYLQNTSTLHVKMEIRLEKSMPIEYAYSFCFGIGDYRVLTRTKQRYPDGDWNWDQESWPL